MLVRWIVGGIERRGGRYGRSRKSMRSGRASRRYFPAKRGEELLGIFVSACSENTAQRAVKCQFSFYFVNLADNQLLWQLSQWIELCYWAGPPVSSCLLTSDTGAEVLGPLPRVSWAPSPEGVSLKRPSMYPIIVPSSPNAGATCSLE
jgi:hypothetical protein